VKEKTEAFSSVYNPTPHIFLTSKICRVELCTELFYAIYLVSMLFADLLSLHLVTRTKFSMNICAMFIAARKITQLNMMEESHQRRAF